MNENPNPQNQVASPVSQVGGTENTPPTTLPQPVETPKKRFRISRKWAFIITAAIVVLAGGGAAAYYGYYVPNKPNNVVYKAFANFVASNNKQRSFSFTDSTSNKGHASNNPFFNLAINGGMDADDNIRADAQVSMSVFKVTTSAIIRTHDKEMYLKVNELPSLLQLYGDSPALNRLAQKLDNNWLRLNVNDLKEAGLINSKQADSANKCVDSLSDYITSQSNSLSNNLEFTYKSHPFANAEKIGSEVVDGVQTTKYSLKIDKTKASDFFKQLDASFSASAKTVDRDCGNSTDSQSSDQQLENSDISNLFVWVDSHKELKKVSATVSDKTSNSDITATFGNKRVDTAKPTNVLTIKDLQTELNQLLGGGSIQSLSGSSLSI